MCWFWNQWLTFFFFSFFLFIFPNLSLTTPFLRSPNLPILCHPFCLHYKHHFATNRTIASPWPSMAFKKITNNKDPTQINKKSIPKGKWWTIVKPSLACQHEPSCGIASDHPLHLVLMPHSYHIQGRMKPYHLPEPQKLNVKPVNPIVNREGDHKSLQIT